MADKAQRSQRPVTRIVALLLAIQSILSGLNWWIKLLPFPHVGEVMDGPTKHEIVRTMIETGWMFPSAKVIEIALGLALLFNRHVVLALVIAFPVMLMTFLLDLLPFLGQIGPFLAGDLPLATLWTGFLDMLFFGAGIFVMQAYLMSVYFDDYRRLFVVTPSGEPAAWSAVFGARWLRTMLCWLSCSVGALSTLWIVGLASGLIPWDSLRILAP